MGNELFSVTSNHIEHRASTCRRACRATPPPSVCAVGGSPLAVRHAMFLKQHTNCERRLGHAWVAGCGCEAGAKLRRTAVSNVNVPTGGPTSRCVCQRRRRRPPRRRPPLAQHVCERSCWGRGSGEDDLVGSGEGVGACTLGVVWCTFKHECPLPRIDAGCCCDWCVDGGRWRPRWQRHQSEYVSRCSVCDDKRSHCHVWWRRA